MRDLFMPPWNWKPLLPLHAALEAPLLGPAEHVDPLAHGEVTGGGGEEIGQQHNSLEHNTCHVYL